EADDMFDMLGATLCIVLNRHASDFRNTSVHQTAQLAARLFSEEASGLLGSGDCNVKLRLQTDFFRPLGGELSLADRLEHFSKFIDKKGIKVNIEDLEPDPIYRVNRARVTLQSTSTKGVQTNTDQIVHQVGTSRRGGYANTEGSMQEVTFTDITGGSPEVWDSSLVVSFNANKATDRSLSCAGYWTQQKGGEDSSVLRHVFLAHMNKACDDNNRQLEEDNGQLEEDNGLLEEEKRMQLEEHAAREKSEAIAKGLHEANEDKEEAVEEAVRLEAVKWQKEMEAALGALEAERQASSKRDAEANDNLRVTWDMLQRLARKLRVEKKVTNVGFGTAATVRRELATVREVSEAIAKEAAHVAAEEEARIAAEEEAAKAEKLRLEEEARVAAEEEAAAKADALRLEEEAAAKMRERFRLMLAERDATAQKEISDLNNHLLAAEKAAVKMRKTLEIEAAKAKKLRLKEEARVAAEEARIAAEEEAAKAEKLRLEEEA
ncbi:hypothetical protein TrRE_jg7166, partial [Triparma retinervis]